MSERPIQQGSRLLLVLFRLFHGQVISSQSSDIISRSSSYFQTDLRILILHHIFNTLKATIIVLDYQIILFNVNFHQQYLSGSMNVVSIPLSRTVMQFLVPEEVPFLYQLRGARLYSQHRLWSISGRCCSSSCRGNGSRRRYRTGQQGSMDLERTLASLAVTWSC